MADEEWCNGGTIDVPRRKTDKDKDPWWSTTTINRKKYVYISCPVCGRGIVLVGYRIRPDGTLDASPMSPSVGCSYCSFHKNVRLLDWDMRVIT